MMGHKNPRKIPIPTGQIIKNAAGEPIGLRSVYGIHESEVYADQADKQQPSALDRALSIEKKLFEAASATLREAGEESDLEAVVGITDPITASDVLTEWCAAIAARSCRVTGDEVIGSYEAPVVMAARFLYAQRMLSIPPPRAQGLDAIESIIANFLATAACYADAYYVWRFECDGAHAAAFSKAVISEAAGRGLAKIAAKQDEREDIIVGAVKDLIDVPNISAGKIAKDRYKTINAALVQHGLRQITNRKTLTRTLQRIRKRKAGG